MAKRRASSSYPSPRSPQRRRISTGSPLRTAAARRMSALRIGRRAAQGAAGLARFAVKSVPYVAAAETAYGAGKWAYNRLKAKKRRQGSDANSKARGKFANVTRKKSLADKYAENGFVYKLEAGKVHTTLRQVAYVGHSTMPARLTGRVILSALVKKLFVKAGFTVKNENELLLNIQGVDSAIKLGYKNNDGGAIQEKEFTLPWATTSIVSIVGDINGGPPGTPLGDSMQNFMFGTDKSKTYQWLYMRYFTKWSGTSYQLQSEIDLTQTFVQIYGKSHLKIQNRTINTAGENEADDVDNVPIDGRYFEFKTNSTIYRDFNLPAADEKPAITTDTYYGLLPSATEGPFNPSITDTKMYEELPDRKAFLGCYGIGKSHLDPGEIKTSTMVSHEYHSMNKILRVIYGQSLAGAGTAGPQNQVWLGKTRLFGWEKLVNAVAMTTTNQFNIAYEHQLEIGCDIIVKRSNYTAPAVQVVAPVNI